MADLSPAPAPREGGPRAHRASAPSPPPRSRSGSEPEEAELSLSLARTKTRSYGSTASVRAPLCAGVIERHVEHRVRAGDTLQGIALKYGVTGFVYQQVFLSFKRTESIITPFGDPFLAVLM
ncbi:hypothetical protein A6R68_11276 [Neotoma lepida]|uniref:LysM and putative peptidoglycan-binding domain-containing protein 2 n=1 Tax=Neotoma lepida TaxID=56216 RepID=A0A1A6FWN3_NEOLE|nr:hypothetical protein A6R68_11276 [Neotoma lepida]